MKVRLPFLIVGVVLLLLGLLWALQGAGVVGGSFMSGKVMWLVIGIVVALVGAALGSVGLGLVGARAQRT
jgi:hypothetical protein